VDSGENLEGCNWYGIAWGAECAWNASATTVEAFNQRVGPVLFGHDGPEFGEAIEVLGLAHRLPAFEDMNDKCFWKVGFDHWLKDEKATTIHAEALKSIVRLAKAKLAVARTSARVNAEVLDQFTFGAERMQLMADRIIEGGRAGLAYRQAAAAPASSEASVLIESGCIGRVRKLRDTCVALKARYIELWNRENRPFALDVVTRRFDAAVAYYDDMLKRLAAAEEDLRNHRPLPPIEQIGFPAKYTGS
jgi:hexosaminidase